MKKLMVILLVLVMVFVMVGSVVGAHQHDGPQHGGLGYWMNYEYEEGWTALCGRNAEFFTSAFRTPPRGNPVEILRRHHLVTFLNWSENRYFVDDTLYTHNPMPIPVAEAFYAAFNDLMPPQEGADGYDEWKPSTRAQLLKWKNILEAWNEGNWNEGK